jgi:cob(I)alamin adenosyltransferase
VAKDSARIAAIGESRRAQHGAGIAADRGAADAIAASLTRPSMTSSDLGASYRCRAAAVTDRHVERLEQAVEHFNADLGPLKSSSCPAAGGGALTHVARTVCRRAERAGALGGERPGERARTPLPQPALISCSCWRAR